MCFFNNALPGSSDCPFEGKLNPGFCGVTLRMCIYVCICVYICIYVMCGMYIYIYRINIIKLNIICKYIYTYKHIMICQYMSSKYRM